jgi:hypothetical protein
VVVAGSRRFGRRTTSELEGSAVAVRVAIHARFVDASVSSHAGSDARFVNRRSSEQLTIRPSVGFSELSFSGGRSLLQVVDGFGCNADNHRYVNSPRNRAAVHRHSC